MLQADELVKLFRARRWDGLEYSSTALGPWEPQLRLVSSHAVRCREHGVITSTCRVDRTRQAGVVARGELDGPACLALRRACMTFGFGDARVCVRQRSYYS